MVASALKQLEALALREHRIEKSDDEPFASYICKAHDDSINPGACDCGAEQHNAAVKSLVEQLEKAVPRWVMADEKLPITTGLYECAVQSREGGKLYPAFLLFGQYEFTADDVPVLRDGESWDENDGSVIGTGFHEETEQFGWSHDFAMLVYSVGKYEGQGRVVYWREYPALELSLPQPPEAQ